MWIYGVAMVVELGGFWWLLRRYQHRRARRKKSDHIQMLKTEVKTQKFHIALTDLRHKRDIINELEHLFK